MEPRMRYRTREVEEYDQDAGEEEYLRRLYDRETHAPAREYDPDEPATRDFRHSQNGGADDLAMWRHPEEPVIW